MYEYKVTVRRTSLQIPLQMYKYKVTVRRMSLQIPLQMYEYKGFVRRTSLQIPLQMYEYKGFVRRTSLQILLQMYRVLSNKTAFFLNVAFKGTLGVRNKGLSIDQSGLILLGLQMQKYIFI